MSFGLHSDPEVMQSVEPADFMTGKVSDRYVASLDTTSAGCAAAQHIFRVADSRVSSPSGLAAAPNLASNGWLYISRSSEITSQSPTAFLNLPNEILLHILGYLDVSDLLSTSRANHQLRELALTPILHANRLRRNRAMLPPLLCSPCRPSRSDLIARSIVQTRTSIVSRRLDRKLISIRLSRRLAARPSAEILVQRCVLPRECVPGLSAVHVAPALVARRRAIEKERLKDGLRSWVGDVWKGEVRQRREAQHEERSHEGAALC